MLQKYESVAEVAEADESYYTLLGHRDHLLVEGQTLLTDLMVSDDMVKIGNALRDYAGIPQLEALR